MNIDDITRAMCEWVDDEEKGSKKGVIILQFKEQNNGIEIGGCIAGRRGTLIEGVCRVYMDEDKAGIIGCVFRDAFRKAKFLRLSGLLEKIKQTSMEESDEKPVIEQKEADK